MIVRRRMAIAVGMSLIGLMYALGAGSVGALDAAGHLAPLLLVLLPLMGGHYPYELALVRRRVGRRPPQLRVRLALRASPVAVPRTSVPRGGGLLASALAGRAPPVMSPS